MVTPTGKREAVAAIVEGTGMSQRRTCGLMEVSRTTVRYRPRRREGETELRATLKALAFAKPRYGYQRLWNELRRSGRVVNRKRVYRLYKLESLQVRRKTRRKLCSGPRTPPATPQRPNERWSMDFMHDVTADGRPFRLLNIIDDCSREWVGLDVGRSLPGARVVSTLERLRLEGRLPSEIVMDNGPEFTSKALDMWAATHGVKLHFSRPGKPTDNAFVESFNGKLRDECLSMNWFLSVDDARRKLEDHQVVYNESRPHQALGYQTPKEFAATFAHQTEQPTDAQPALT